MRSGFLGTVGLAMVLLKLMGVLTLPWVWVLAPFWLPLALVVLGLVFAPLLAVGAVLLSPFWLLPIFLLVLFGLTLIPFAAIVFAPIWLPILLVAMALATLTAGLCSKRTKTPPPHQQEAQRNPYTKPQHGDDAVDIDSERL